MKEILEAQQTRIQRQQERIAKDTAQLVLGFNSDEQRQLAADQRHWDARLASLKREIEDEPMRIRRGYEIRASRVEAVGLVYLWPTSS